VAADADVRHILLCRLLLLLLLLSLLLHYCCQYSISIRNKKVTMRLRPLTYVV
jgi:hypothetical protein